MNTVIQHRQNNFDFIRFFAATLVFLSHSLAISGRNQPMLMPGYSYASLGLTIFFFISGFLIAASWAKHPHAGTFLKSRILRIYPGLMVNILITIVIIGALATTLSLGDYFAYIKNNAGGYAIAAILMQIPDLPGCFAHNPITHVNGSLWSLPIEFQMYLLLLLFGVAGLLNKKTFPLAFASWCILYGKTAFSPAEFPASIQCMSFIIGSFFYLYRDRLKPHGGMAIFCFLGVALIPWVPPIIAAALLLLSLPYLIFYIAFSNRAPLHNFGKFGDFSYGIYIYAYPVQQLFYDWFGNRLGLAGYSVASFSAVLLLAVFSWHCIEKPFLKLKA